MRRTAVVFALFSELLPTARLLGVSVKRMRPRMFFSDGDVALVRSGIGRDRARRAAETAVAQFKPELIISAGLCGALVEELKIGDVVVSDLSDGKIFCSPRPLFTYEEKAAAHIEHKAVAVDMESEAVGVVARRHGVKFIAIKSVSDGLKDDLPRPPFGPASLFGLIRFKRSCDIASRRLSEFLVSYIKEAE